MKKKNLILFVSSILRPFIGGHVSMHETIHPKRDLRSPASHFFEWDEKILDKEVNLKCFLFKEIQKM